MALIRPALSVLALTTLTCTLGSPAMAQPRDLTQYAHRAWLNRDLSAKDAITSIAQTPDGYLWFATMSGLIRFDGVRATPWHPPVGQQLPSDWIHTVMVARDGTLWISTFKGVASWRDGKLTRYTELPATTPMLEASDRTIWFGRGRQVCTIRSGAAKETCVPAGTAAAPTFSVLEDRKGNIWVTTDGSLWRWSPGEPKRFAMPDSGSGKAVLGIDDELLVSAGDRIWRLNGEAFDEIPVVGLTASFALSPATPDRFTRTMDFFRTSDGSLWISTLEGILHVQSGKTDRFTVADGLSSDYILEYFEDVEGNVWVSTNNGLDRFTPLPVQTFTTRQGLSSAAPWSVQATADGSVWIGTPAGLDRVTPDGPGRASALSAVEDRQVRAPIYALGLDDRGTLLASTATGVLAYDGARFVPVAAAQSGPFIAVAGTHDRSLWLTTGRGELLRRTPDGAIRPIDIPKFERPSGARVLLTDPDGGLWMGFDMFGVGYRAGADARITAFTNPDRGMFGDTTHLRLGSDGALWAAARTGLVRVKDGSVRLFGAKNGLPCGGPHWSVEDDDHALWAYGPCGLTRIDASEWQGWVSNPKKVVKARLLNADDGVKRRSNGYVIGPNVTKASDGRIWFVVTNGISVVDPRRLGHNPRPPHVVIDAISAAGTSYGVASAAAARVRLPRAVRDVEIDYLAVTHTAPEKTRFRVKLDGREAEWRELVNQRRVAYSNLTPGAYRFHVTAANSSGVWSEEEAVLDFDVVPAVYQTIWFRSLAVVGLVALVWGVNRVRVGQRTRREQRSRDELDTIPAMAFTALADGSRTFVNRRWVDYTGQSVAQATGASWQDVVHPDNLERVLDNWRVALATGAPVEYEARLRDAAGNYRSFLVRAVPERDKRGQILKWHGVATDIEDRKRAEDERWRSEEALTQTRSELAHVARVTTLGALTASIAHEVNQPLSGIITNASTCLRMLAADDPDLDGARETARRTIRDGNRASDVIARLRDLFTKKDLAAEPVDLDEAAREVLALSASELQKNKVTVRSAFAEHLPRVIGDRVQLQQVILNLLLNASQAMRDVVDRPRSLDVKTAADGAGHVQISVTDTGVGIEPEAAARLFEPFYTTKPDGMGIGLSVCRSIVERHGGRLWAEPNGGPGMTFFVSLPCES